MSKKSRGIDYEKRAFRRINRQYDRRFYKKPRRCPECGHLKTIWHAGRICFECYLLERKVGGATVG